MASFPSAKGFVTQDKLEVTKFNGGLNTLKAEYDILDSQAASCYNVYNAEIEGLDSRFGYTRYYATAFGSASVNALFLHNQFTTSTLVFAMGSCLYKDLGTGTASEVCSDISTGTIRGFEMEGNLYLLDGSGYIQYDTSGAGSVVPYIPTYWIDGDPDGTGGAQLDELNFLTGSFIQTFNGDGHSTGFYLQFGSITGTSVIVKINDVTQTTGAASAGYTVDFSSGIINLTTAATTGIGIVSIQAQKDILQSTCVTKCTLCLPYGVGNTVNAYLGGNPTYPARMFWSDLQDPTYFPATSYVDVGIKNDKLTGFLGHANSLLVFKYGSIHAWNGVPPNNTLTEIYMGEGCIAPDSLKLVGGYPTFFSQKGVCILEKEGLGYAVNLISEDVNGVANIRDGMITESLANKQSCFAWIHDKRYYLWLNEKIWVHQYTLVRTEDNKRVSPWVPWTSTYNFADAKAFAVKDDYLYFTGTGNIFKFDPLVLDDDGNAINSYWLSKQFDINRSYDIIKSFNYANWNLRAYSNIATSDLILTVINSGHANGQILTMTPSTSVAFVEYSIRTPIHYKSNMVQYSVLQNNVSGGFSLLGVKIKYNPARKVIDI